MREITNTKHSLRPIVDVTLITKLSNGISGRIIDTAIRRQHVLVRSDFVICDNNDRT